MRAAIGAVAVCVSLLAATDAAATFKKGRFTVDAKQEVVDDAVTKRQWQRVIDGKPRTLSEAQAYCKGLPLAGGGWRAPTLRELQSLVDRSPDSQLGNEVYFPPPPAGAFWSTTPAGVKPGTFWQQWTSQDWHNPELPSKTAFVRCVRG